VQTQSSDFSHGQSPPRQKLFLIEIPEEVSTKHLAGSFPLFIFFRNQQYMNWRINFKKQVSYYGRQKRDNECMFFQKKQYMVLVCVQKHVPEYL